jgi:hypothetical protein
MLRETPSWAPRRVYTRGPRRSSSRGRSLPSSHCTAAHALGGHGIEKHSLSTIVRQAMAITLGSSTDIGESCMRLFKTLIESREFNES